MSSESQEFLIGCAPFGDLLVGGSGGEALRNTLRAGAEVRIRVGGTSMLPAIWPGDIVSISCQGTEEPDYPDVVLFKAERRLFVHRVLRSENGRLITRGDALPHCDPPVDVADVIGVVT